MRVRIVTLTRHTFIINVHPSASIEELKARLTQETGIPLAGQRLVYKGEELVSGTIEEVGILEEDFVVVVVVQQSQASTRSQVAPQRPDERLPLQESSIVQPHQIPHSMSRHLDVDEEDLVDDDDDADEGIEDEEDSDALQQLIDMGFRANRANKALIITRGNTQMAMDWLLEHDGDPDIDEPLSLEQIDRIRNGEDDHDEGIIDQQEAVQRLMELGFTEEDITYALEATGHDFEAAAAWLLGDRDFAYRNDLPDDGNGDPMASADDPDFQSLHIGRILHMHDELGADDDDIGLPRE